MTNGAGARYVLDLNLPAAHSGVRVARSLTRRFARLEGLADAEAEALTLVVSELLANAIDHGGAVPAMEEDDLDSDTRMHLKVTINGSTWEARVSDEAGGDPGALRAALAETAAPDLEDERGRGLFLMAQMVDRLDVERSPDGRGLTIVATKRHR